MKAKVVFASYNSPIQIGQACVCYDICEINQGQKMILNEEEKTNVEKLLGALGTVNTVNG